MTRINQPCRALLISTGVLTILLLAAACGNDRMGGMEHGGAASTTAVPGVTFNDADVRFAQSMIPHHQQAVEMAAVAAAKASDPEIKQIAAQIQSAQEPEIRMLTGWLSEWRAATAPAGGHGSMSMPGMMSEAEMAELNAATGAAFDRIFARMMIAHHNGAIQMAKEEQAKGINPEAKALADTIERTQAAEVVQLQKIVNRW